MARKCLMCGREIADGVVCEKCDKPRKKTDTAASAPVTATAATSSRPASAATPEARAAGSHSAPQTFNAHALDPFPKAPIVPFPVESASPAITSVVSVLVAAGVPSILVGPDGTVKFVSDAARKLFDPTADISTLKSLETVLGVRIGDTTIPSSIGVHAGDRNLLLSVVPISGGASGAVLIMRAMEALQEAQVSFMTYIYETVVGPLRSLRDTYSVAVRDRGSDPLLTDSIGTLEHVLDSLELVPGAEAPAPAVRAVAPKTLARPTPSVTEVVRRVSDRFAAAAELKGVRIQVDAQELQLRFADHEQLALILAILVENALHYVPEDGQMVIGVRSMEHKGQPLLLFFVMDTGALVPEPLRQTIFEPSFTWNPSGAERTGRGLAAVRDFAAVHGGSVWVESKTGRACTFFIRVLPDSVS